MIILDDTDAASVHTLVQLPAPDTSLDAKPEIPGFLSPLTFTSFTFSVPSFTLALLNVSLTRLHTIPTLVAFIFGVPFHIGTILILSRISVRPQPMASSLAWRVDSITYVTILLSLWICTGIINGLVLVGRWQILNKICSPLYQNNPTCNVKAQIMFTVSTISAAIEVILLGTILMVLSRRDPFHARGSNNRNSTLETRFWKVPLTFASLVFTVPPLVVAVLNINISFTTMYSIPTIVAYVLTAPFHIGIIIMWRISCRQPSLPFEALTTKRCISFVLFLLSTWLLSTIMGGRLTTHPKLLENTCGGPPGLNPRCEAQTQTFFAVSTISSAFEVLILSVIFITALTRFLQNPKDETILPPATRQIQTFKGPMIVRSEGA